MSDLLEIHFSIMELHSASQDKRACPRFQVILGAYSHICTAEINTSSIPWNMKILVCAHSGVILVLFLEFTWHFSFKVLKAFYRFCFINCHNILNRLPSNLMNGEGRRRGSEKFSLETWKDDNEIPLFTQPRLFQEQK